MTPRRPVDLPRVRRALEALDRLAARTPGLAAGPPTPDDVAALAADLEVAMSPDPKLSTNLTLRLAPDLRDRVEAYRASMEAALPAGVRAPTLSDAARMLIVRGLEAVEGADRG